MNDEIPFIAEKTPAVLELEEGTYWWCQCGLSKNQPFCDGSHETTKFLPVKFEITTRKKYALCRCKQTKKAPFCDGSHKTLNER